MLMNTVIFVAMYLVSFIVLLIEANVSICKALRIAAIVAVCKTLVVIAINTAFAAWT